MTNKTDFALVRLSSHLAAEGSQSPLLRRRFEILRIHVAMDDHGLIPHEMSVTLIVPPDPFATWIRSRATKLQTEHAFPALPISPRLPHVRSLQLFDNQETILTFRTPADRENGALTQRGC